MAHMALMEENQGNDIRAQELRNLCVQQRGGASGPERSLPCRNVRSDSRQDLCLRRYPKLVTKILPPLRASVKAHTVSSAAGS